MDVSILIPVLAIIVMSIVIHEVAHGYMAFCLGDMTAYYRGRLSLNPIRHIDPFMTVLLPIMLLVGSGGRFVFGGAKPVPINPLAFRGVSMRRGMMLTALAGPMANVAVALACSLALAFALTVWHVGNGSMGGYQDSLAFRVFSLSIALNLILACFNLIPVPPLDGSRVLSYYLPREWSQAMDRLEQRFGIMLIFGLLILSRLGGLDIVGWFIQPALYLTRYLLFSAATVAKAAGAELLGIF